MDKKLNNSIDKNNLDVENYKNNINGIKNDSPLPKDELDQQLDLLSKSEDKSSGIIRNTCYCPRLPLDIHEIEPITGQHYCKTCGRSYIDIVVSSKISKGKKIEFTLKDAKEENIDKHVRSIKKFGFNAIVMHMCGQCVNERFGNDFINKQDKLLKNDLAEKSKKNDFYIFDEDRFINKNSKSVSILIIKHKSATGYAINVVSRRDLEDLLDFLQGLNKTIVNIEDLKQLKELSPRFRRLLGL